MGLTLPHCVFTSTLEPGPCRHGSRRPGSEVALAKQFPERSRQGVSPRHPPIELNGRLAGGLL